MIGSHMYCRPMANKGKDIVGRNESTSGENHNEIHSESELGDLWDCGVSIC